MEWKKKTIRNCLPSFSSCYICQRSIFCLLINVWVQKTRVFFSIYIYYMQNVDSSCVCVFTIDRMKYILYCAKMNVEWKAADYLPCFPIETLYGHGNQYNSPMKRALPNVWCVWAGCVCVCLVPFAYTKIRSANVIHNKCRINSERVGFFRSFPCKVHTPQPLLWWGGWRASFMSSVCLVLMVSCGDIV